MLTFKLQNANRKETVEVQISKYDTMNILMSKYAQTKSLDLSTLKFRFDGENLDPSETPETLELEGGECIDVFKKI